MAYDAALVERVRPLLDDVEPVDERRMFGGLAFMVHGHMAVCVSGKGGLMVRVDAADLDALLDREGASSMVMAGRPSRTWLRVTGPTLDDPAVLADWVARGARTAIDLPPVPG